MKTHPRFELPPPPPPKVYAPSTPQTSYVATGGASGAGIGKGSEGKASGQTPSRGLPCQDYLQFEMRSEEPRHIYGPDEEDFNEFNAYFHQHGEEREGEGEIRVADYKTLHQVVDEKGQLIYPCDLRRIRFAHITVPAST